MGLGRSHGHRRHDGKSGWGNAGSDYAIRTSLRQRVLLLRLKSAFDNRLLNALKGMSHARRQETLLLLHNGSGVGGDTGQRYAHSRR